MATTITKLFRTGVLQSSVEFDEITHNNVRISPTGVYASEFDEITMTGEPVAERRTRDGKLLVSGFFDEVTLPPNFISQTYFITNNSQVFTVPTNGPAERLGGKFTDGNTFNDAIWNDLIPVGSRVTVKWSLHPVEVYMGVVTQVEKGAFSFSNHYVYITNPSGFDLPIYNISNVANSIAEYFIVEISTSPN